MKIALNKDYGGFELSQKAYERLIELGVEISKDRTSPEQCIHEYTGEDIEFYGRYSMYLGHDVRTNPLLIQVIEELGDDANNEISCIEIVEIPDDIEYEINDHDGIETVHEIHRIWE